MATYDFYSEPLKRREKQIQKEWKRVAREHNKQIRGERVDRGVTLSGQAIDNCLVALFYKELKSIRKEMDMK